MVLWTLGKQQTSKSILLFSNAFSSIRPSVPCHQMIQVYNSKAVGAEDAELGTRVRWPVPNVTNLQLGQSTTSGAPSARVYIHIHVRHNENKHQEWKI